MLARDIQMICMKLSP